jgi:hypothetical protein
MQGVVLPGVEIRVGHGLQAALHESTSRAGVRPLVHARSCDHHRLRQVFSQTSLVGRASREPERGRSYTTRYRSPLPAPR